MTGLCNSLHIPRFLKIFNTLCNLLIRLIKKNYKKLINYVIIILHQKSNQLMFLIILLEIKYQ
jgi:hypothetical protein